MTATETHRTINAVWRIESARIIAGIARMVRDVGLAEDLAQDALVAALEQWPESGVPDNPGAWLMAVAKRRAIDQLRRRTRLDRTEAKLAIEVEAQLERAAPIPIRRSMTTSATTCCASCSPPAIRCSRPKPESP